jgi:hypothetical protein
MSSEPKFWQELDPEFLLQVDDLIERANLAWLERSYQKEVFQLEVSAGSRRLAEFESIAGMLAAANRPAFRQRLLALRNNLQLPMGFLRLATLPESRNRLTALMNIDLLPAAPVVQPFASPSPVQPLQCSQPGYDDELLEKQAFAEMTTIINERDAAIRPIWAMIDASHGNMFADPVPLYSSLYNQHRNFLARIAKLAAPAQELADRGCSRLKQSLEPHKTDSEGACRIIQQMLAAEASQAQSLQQIAWETNKKLVDSQLGINTGWKKVFE